MDPPWIVMSAIIVFAVGWGVLFLSDRWWYRRHPNGNAENSLADFEYEDRFKPAAVRARLAQIHKATEFGVAAVGRLSLEKLLLRRK